MSIAADHNLSPRDRVVVRLDNPVADHESPFEDTFRIDEVDAADDLICTGDETGVEIAVSANGAVATLLSNAEDFFGGAMAGTRWPIRTFTPDA